MKAKQILRKQLRQQIAHKQGGSEDISSLQNHLDEFANFANKTVALYQADSQELCLTDFFKSSEILLPRFNAQEKVYDFSLWSGEQKDLQMGPYDIAEPRVLSELKYIDYCFIPALAFDRRGNRLGRGGGFYDRLLAKYSIGTKVGVCYDFQLIEDVPSEDHDYVMDFILSPSGLFKCDRKN
jgi:5-formyltetrahydrofolate cyclo-ligase